MAEKVGEPESHNADRLLKGKFLVQLSHFYPNNLELTTFNRFFPSSKINADWIKNNLDSDDISAHDNVARMAWPDAEPVRKIGHA